MPAAGETIIAYQSVVQVSDSTAINDETNTSFVTGSPVLSTTFVVPPSGAIEILPYVRCNADTFTPPLFLLFGYEIYEGASASGTLIYSPATEDTASIVFLTSPATNNWVALNLTVHSGLTAGATHFIRGMHRVSGGSTIDITHRRLTVRPVI